MSATQTAKVMMSKHGRAKELCDLLCKDLQIPPRVRWFQVRFAMDEPVVVTCEYMPEESTDA